MKTFIMWLKSKRNENSIVGDLALDTFHYLESSIDYAQLLRKMKRYNASKEAYNALDQAKSEYLKYVENIEFSEKITPKTALETNYTLSMAALKDFFIDNNQPLSKKKFLIIINSYFKSIIPPHLKGCFILNYNGREQLKNEGRLPAFDESLKKTERIKSAQSMLFAYYCRSIMGDAYENKEHPSFQVYAGSYLKNHPDILPSDLMPTLLKKYPENDSRIKNSYFY